MIIGIAGPYTAATAEEMEQNSLALNIAAARVLELGHIPLIGINAALPVLAQATVADEYKAGLDISLAVIDRCEALLFIGESPGANRERELVSAKGLPIYYSLEEIPSPIAESN